MSSEKQGDGQVPCKELLDGLRGDWEQAVRNNPTVNRCYQMALREGWDQHLFLESVALQLLSECRRTQAENYRLLRDWPKTTEAI